MDNDELNTKYDEIIQPYYVYVLVDPLLSNEIFYVGKGKSQRGHDHFKEALKVDAKDSQKIKRINSIRNRGSEPLVRVIGRFDSPEKAFAVESTLIHWIYGFENLTNNQPGHDYRHIRSKKEGLNLEIQGIDIPKRIKITGKIKKGYLQDIRANHQRLNHFELMEDLYGFLKEKALPVEDEVFGLEGGRHLAICIRIAPQAKLILHITDSEKNTIILNLRPNSEKIKDRKIFTEFVKRVFQVEVKNKGRYAKLNSWKDLNVNIKSRDKICKIIKGFIKTYNLM